MVKIEAKNLNFRQRIIVKFANCLLWIVWNSFDDKDKMLAETKDIIYLTMKGLKKYQ